MNRTEAGELNLRACRTGFAPGIPFGSKDELVRMTLIDLMNKTMNKYISRCRGVLQGEDDSFFY
ncbi:hypothetical protein BK126_18755 [Paenibacillus sp. FSL H7-0326]|nr:hypothetical protein BK126_18755 [Paenibacillus sp. FSL H7-0326]